MREAINKKDNKNTVKELVVLKTKTDKKKFLVLIIYNDRLAGVNYQMFKGAAYMGNKVLKENGFTCESSSHTFPVDAFARAHEKESWETLDGFPLPDFFMEKVVDIKKEIDFKEVKKFENKEEFLNDFIQKCKT